MMQVVETARLEPDKFCFWMQGFCELHGKPPTEEQWKIIKEHLEMVFVKVRPITQTTTTSVPNSPVDWQKITGGQSAAYVC